MTALLLGDMLTQTELSDIEIVHLDTEGFEYNYPAFWFLFDHTVARLLARHIERKSEYLIRSSLNDNAKWNDATQRAKLISKARRNNGTVMVPALFSLKTTFFNRSSPLMQHFCKTVSRAPALDDVYNATGEFYLNGKRVFPLSAKPDFWSNLYLSCPNAMSVRNRYKVVMDQYIKTGGGKTLSIACGSAQPIIHAIHNLPNRDGAELILSDPDSEALEIALQRAKLAGVSSLTKTMEKPFTELVCEFGENSFDIVEACGILDYLPNPIAIKLLKVAKTLLKDSGTAIFSNMNRTRAADLLTRTYNWSIIYRTPEEFGALVKEAGFSKVRVYVEPWRVHPVAVATT